MSQKERIKEYLVKTSRGLTQLEAAIFFNPAILRLSERIRELQADGFPIKKIEEKHDGGLHTRYIYDGDEQMKIAI